MTKSVKVQGFVQGVGYRIFVQEQARLLDVRGEVWNCRDGSVGVLAQHEEPIVLEAFERRLRQGPGRVDSVLSAEVFENLSFTGFRVAGTR